MSLLFCPGCGTGLEPGATFCTNCGRPTATAPAAAPAPPFAPPPPAPAFAPPAPGAAATLPICLGCGIVAPAGRATCTLCGFAIGTSPHSVARTSGDLVWAGIRAATKCRACGGQAPIDGLDLGGVYPCIHCGIDQHMDVSQWNEGLQKAHDVADLAGPGPGAFPGAPIADNPYASIGSEHVKATIGTSYKMFESIPLSLETSPGNPLCEACHVPLFIESAGDPLVVRCPQCRQAHAYTRPPGAPADVVGVVGQHHEQGVRDAAAERDPGGAVAIRCPGCSAPLPVAAVGAVVRCAYCGVNSRLGPAMRRSMGAADATPPRWWALFRGPSQARQLGERAAREQAERRQRAAAAPPPMRSSERFDQLERNAELAGKKAQRNVAVTMIASMGMVAVVGAGAFVFTHRSTSSRSKRTTKVNTAAPASKVAPPAPAYSVTWRGKVTAAKGKPLKRGTPCLAEMTAAGKAVKSFRTICGDVPLYSSKDAMSGMSSYGSAIIEAPGKDGGHQYLLLYHDVGQRTGRNEIQFNSASDCTVSGHGPPAFEVTMSFDDLSSEQSGPAVFPTSVDTSHQLFTAKATSVDGKAPVQNGRSCKLDFYGRGQSASGAVCTVKIDCGTKNVYFTTGYCNTDTRGHPTTFSDKQSASHFSLDVESSRVEMAGQTVSGAYTVIFALTPAKR